MELKTTSPLAKILLVQLWQLWGLKAVVQMSFAEYHSKQYRLEQVFILKNMGHLMFRS